MSVIKLDEDKFRHFSGNMLSLGVCCFCALLNAWSNLIAFHVPGPEISPADFKKLMYDGLDAPHESESVYPPNGLLKLRGILSKEDMRMPNDNKSTPECSSIFRVTKRGSSTLTTVGALSGYLSHRRIYFPTCNIDSTEAEVHPHNNLSDSTSGPFSRKGDSGSVIVDARGRFVALLTSGTGNDDSSPDITYGTPMHWLWPLILAKFPDAHLDWDGTDEVD